MFWHRETVTIDANLLKQTTFGNWLQFNVAFPLLKRIRAKVPQQLPFNQLMQMFLVNIVKDF